MLPRYDAAPAVLLSTGETRGEGNIGNGKRERGDRRGERGEETEERGEERGEG